MLQSKQYQLRLQTRRLLAYLHRGGDYAHLWTDGGNRSYWFRVNRGGNYGWGREQRVRRVPKPWLRHNVYFCVHPLAAIPPHNSSGNHDQRFISSQSNYICAVNALFAEFDGKDYVYALEYSTLLPANFRDLSNREQEQQRKHAREVLFYRSPTRFKRRTLHHIEGLPYPPSVIIDSGGGYHCYWLLRQTVPTDEANRDDVQVIQHGWVHYVGGDVGAADLRRVLRLPGSYNHKPGFGNQPPQVVFVRAAFTQTYVYQELEQAVNEWLYAEQRRQRWRTQRQQQWRRQDAGQHIGQHTAQPNDQTHNQQVRGAAHASAALSTGILDAEAERRRLLRQHFNQQHLIENLLLAHGYQLIYRGRDQVRLARPGPGRHHGSITIFPAQVDGRPERSIHFSTNDPLHSREYVDNSSGKVRRHIHDAFAIYVQLEHNGDWEAAYASVVERGA